MREMDVKVAAGIVVRQRETFTETRHFATSHHERSPVAFGSPADLEKGEQGACAHRGEEEIIVALFTCQGLVNWISSRLVKLYAHREQS